LNIGKPKVRLMLKKLFINMETNILLHIIFYFLHSYFNLDESKNKKSITVQEVFDHLKKIEFYSSITIEKVNDLIYFLFCNNILSEQKMGKNELKSYALHGSAIKYY
jgi:hypothetical protein